MLTSDLKDQGAFPREKRERRAFQMRGQMSKSHSRPGTREPSVVGCGNRAHAGGQNEKETGAALAHTWRRESLRQGEPV